ncbi:MAG: hypothetical protein J7M26_00775 [Armatimonadetes bacterium]|nr:hypothetical protein [Armatimonadota bacterium]
MVMFGGLIAGLGARPALAGVAQKDGRLVAGAAPIVFSARRPAFEARAADRRVTGEFFVLAGAEGEEVKLPVWHLRPAPAGTGRADAQAPARHLSLTFDISEVGGWACVAVTIANDGDQQALLEVGWRVRASLDSPWYWGGRSARPAKTQYEATGLAGVYPLAAVADEQACVAVGYEPSQWLSFLRNKADLRGEPTRLQSSARIVVDASSSETVTFVLGVFATQWRYLEALHQYYEAFPQWFWPTPGVDPRASLNGGSYLLWTSRPRSDLARRLQVGWDWCYAPFRRTGDIYGRPEFWDYEPVRPQKNFRSLPIDEFHQWRKERFERGARAGFLMAFYVPSQIWCEERLAREHYADALTTDPHAKTYFDTPWVTGADNELRVFPLNTSFGRQSRKDMAAVIEELGLDAFAFDTANGGARYYGPAVNSCPGRAWDEQGVFVDEGIAIGKLMDWLHAQRPHGRPVAVIANPGAYATFVSCFHCDSAMLEASPLTVPRGIADGLRYRLGHKTMVFWETYEYSQLLRDDLSREQYVDALRGIADWTLLACLHEVVLPTPRIAMGLTPLVRWLPVLREMALAGWEPVPTARRADGAWVSRAGRGWRCYLATGNEEGHQVSGELVVDDARLGEGRCLWRQVVPAGFPARPVTCVLAHDGTRVAFDLSPREPLVLGVAARVLDAPEGLRATTSVAEDVNTTRLTLELAQRRGKVRLLLPETLLGASHLRLADVRVKGRKASTNASSSSARSVQLTAQAPCTVVAVYKSILFSSPASELLAFPQRQGDHMNFRLTLAPDNEQTRAAARWITDYFREYYQEAPTEPVKVSPPEVVAAEEGQKEKADRDAAIELRLAPGPADTASISLAAPGRLLLRASTGEDLTRAVKELLAVWDRRFVYSGPLPWLDMFKRVGLAGKMLPPRPIQSAPQP